jgi:uncharacterized repeat protein (TIGR03803 family)
MKHACAGAMLLTLNCISALLRAQSTVTLSPTASPETGEPGVTAIIVIGYGFPSGTIPPGNVTVTLQCSKAGGGPSGTTQAIAVQPLFGSTERVTFTIPASIALSQTTAYLISIAGSTSTGATFSSGNATGLDITPVARVSIDPKSGEGGAAQVTITGYHTNFLQGSTQANFGPGVSVGGAPPGAWGPVTVNSPASATAQLVMGIPAAPGTNTVMVATGAEQASPTTGFTIDVAFATFYDFTGGASSGANPKRALVFGNGFGGQPALYGVTPYGGASNDGTVYSDTFCFNCLAFAILHTFTGPPGDGMTPDGALVIDGNGVIYGTTGGGGSHSPNGIVFSLTPPTSPGGAWTETVLHNFAGVPNDGGNSYASLVIGGGGVLYGTTFYGGISGNGVVFSLAPPASSGGAWTETILHKFAGSPNDGANPHTAVTPGAGGVFYGTTYNGGASGNGTVYQLTPPGPEGSPSGGAWTETVLYNFAGTPSDGANPHGDLVIGNGGVLYGTTLNGGTYGFGTVFSLTPPKSQGSPWTETVLYNFAGGTDGAEPRAGLVIEPDGSLYSTTYYGGESGQGTVFSLSPPASPGGAWTETIWIRFAGGNGAIPEAGLVRDSNGVLYGATYNGGMSNLGVLFLLVP